MAARDGIIGSLAKLEYALASRVSFWPEAINGVASDPVQFTSGDFEEIELHGLSASMSSFPIIDSRGQVWSTSITTTLSELTAQNNLLMEHLANNALVLRATDGNGREYLIGTPEAPAYFTYRYGTGGSPAARNGYNTTTSFRHLNPAVIYDTNPAGLITYNAGIITYNNQALLFN